VWDRQQGKRSQGWIAAQSAGRRKHRLAMGDAEGNRRRGRQKMAEVGHKGLYKHKLVIRDSVQS
jgi:hypothetical protein